MNPANDDEGFCDIPEHPSIGIHAGPLFGALGILAGVIRARATGEGCSLEIAQSDAAAVMDWYRIRDLEGLRAPESEVTGNKSDDYERRAPGTAGMRDGVRYQMYEISRRPRAVHGVRAGVLEELLRRRRPDRPVRDVARLQYADHARGNRELQAELRDIFPSRTTQPSGSPSASRSTPRSPR